MPQNPRTQPGKIVSGGMGGFLNPPGHPEHTYHVQLDLDCRPHNRGGCSLSSAVESPYLDESTRSAAKALLQTWKDGRESLDTPELQRWILEVLGYFANCYQNPEVPEAERANVGNLIMDANDPRASVDTHAGVCFIRRYYPEFTPTAEHFKNAKWGN